MKLNLAHVSDLHYEKSGETKQERNTTRRLLSVERELHNIKLNSQHIDDQSNIICLTGDNIDDGSSRQLDTLDISLHKLSTPVLMVPGNHDYYPLGNQFSLFTGFIDNAKRFYELQEMMLKEAQQAFNKRYKTFTWHTFETDQFKRKILGFTIGSRLKKRMTTVDIPGARTTIHMLDSNPTVGADVNFARGEIGPYQLNILRRQLNSKFYDGWYKIVMLHHHPTYNDYFQLLEDADEFIKATWNTANLILVGHKHRFNFRQTPRGHISFAEDLKTSNKNALVRAFTVGNGIITKFHQFSV